MATQTFDDERSIRSLILPSTPHDGGLFAVGSAGVTRIEAYREAGDMGYTLWFAIWKGDILAARQNGNYVDTVNYFEPPDGPHRFFQPEGE